MHIVRIRDKYRNKELVPFGNTNIRATMVSEPGWISRIFNRKPKGPKLVQQKPRRTLIARLPSRYIVDDIAAVSVAQTYGELLFPKIFSCSFPLLFPLQPLNGREPYLQA